MAVSVHHTVQKRQFIALKPSPKIVVSSVNGKHVQMDSIVIIFIKNVRAVRLFYISVLVAKPWNGVKVFFISNQVIGQPIILV